MKNESKEPLSKLDGSEIILNEHGSYDNFKKELYEELLLNKEIAGKLGSYEEFKKDFDISSAEAIECLEKDDDGN